MLGDNNAVILNTILPSSQFKKKHASCAYHMVPKAIISKGLQKQNSTTTEAPNEDLPKTRAHQLTHQYHKHTGANGEKMAKYYVNNHLLLKDGISSTQLPMVIPLPSVVIKIFSRLALWFRSTTGN
jgi:hypothetical protein